MSLFGKDSPLIRFLEKFANLMILNWILILFCIPVVTIGPAITAVYYVTLKMVRNEEGSIVQDFFHSFRTNLKQGILVGLIVLGAGAFLALDIFYIYQLASLGGVFDKFVLAFILFMTVVFCMVLNYVWSILAKFNTTIKDLFRTSAALAVRHLLATVAIGAIGLFVPLVMMWSPPAMALGVVFLLFLGIPGIAYLQSTILIKIFDQYIPAEPSVDEADEEETDDTE